MIMSYVIRLHIWEELFRRFLTPLNIITTDEVGHFIYMAAKRTYMFSRDNLFLGYCSINYSWVFGYLCVH